jgi:hypothetical protein
VGVIGFPFLEVSPRAHRILTHRAGAIVAAHVAPGARGAEVAQLIATTEAAGEHVVHVGGTALASGILERAAVVVALEHH